MEDETYKNIAYVLLGLSFLVMAWKISRLASSNRAATLESHAPKIAGMDEIAGGAQDPSQFDEPDEDALEEMADLLGLDDD